MFQSVPRSRRRRRLLAIDVLHVVRVEPPEVDQLARGVDLRLECRLRLTEHGRGVEPHAPRPGEQIGCAQKDRRAVLPRHARPRGVRGERHVDRALDFHGARLVPGGEGVRVAVRHDHAGDLARLDARAADSRRDVDRL